MSVKTNNDVKNQIALVALQKVIDPEIGLNVVDLGLIYCIDYDDVKKIADCTMTLTTQFCPMGESITDGIKNALEQSFSNYLINVILTFEPAWSYDLISDKGRLFLRS